MVQTFMPYANIIQSAFALDEDRLRKQVVEAKQLRLAVFAHETGCIYYCDKKYQYYPEVNKFYKGKHDIIHITSISEHAIKTKNGKPKKVGWLQHPAAKQWFGYYEALTVYQLIMHATYLERKWDYDTPKLVDNKTGLTNKDWDDVEKPAWYGRYEFYLSHKARLYQKDPVYYSRFAQDYFVWREHDATANYWWPTNNGY